MPNWTQNTLTLTGEKSNLEKFKQAVKGENGVFDFSRIVPMPKHIDTFHADGENNWHDWSIEHWGTKWNACYGEIDEDSGMLAYNFYTAWDAPRPLVEPIAKLAHDLDLEIEWEAEHEFDGYELIFSEGDVQPQAA